MDLSRAAPYTYDNTTLSLLLTLPWLVSHQAARFFHVEFLVEACCDYLVHQLGMENYQNVLVLADKYWLGDLRHDIFSFLGNNIVKLSEVSGGGGGWRW